MENVTFNPLLQEVLQTIEARMPFPIKTHPFTDEGRKKSEGTVNARGFQICPLRAPSKIWGWKAKHAYYSVHMADRLPHFRIEDDPNCHWQIGFVYRLGPDSPYYDRLLPILREFERQQHSQGKQWIIVPRGHLLVNEWEWKFLHLVRRYRTAVPSELADDFVTLVRGTFDHVNAATI